MADQPPDIPRLPRFQRHLTGGGLRKVDPEIFAAVVAEEKRQRENIELIASENFTSRAVMEAQGSVLTNKYAEGYPGKRWYGGCENVDTVERLAIDRAKQLFSLRTCERPAAQRRAGEHGRLLRHAKARRQNSRHEPRAWRPSHPWPSGKFFRQILPGLAVWRQRRDGADRLRRSAKASRGGSPSHDHRRGVSLSAHHRFPPPPANRRFRRRAFVHRHGAHLRARGRRAASHARFRTRSSSPPPRTRVFAVRAAVS